LGEVPDHEINNHVGNAGEEMMRVTIVTESYFPQVNGVSRTLGELVRHLSECGDTVQLIHPDYGPTMDRDDRAYPVRSMLLPFYQELRLPLPPFGSVHRAIASFDPDIIHIATEATLGLSALRFALRRGFRAVSSFHTNFVQYSGHYRVGWTRGLIERYLRWFHNQARVTYVPSEATIRELERLGLERLVLWKRGVDARLFRPDRAGRCAVRRAHGWRPEEVVISSVSRLAPEKNVAYLAEALAIVAARRPEVRVLVVGDGPSRAGLEHRIGSFARFAGYRQGEDLANHYAVADIFVFSSLTETFGNVVLEAMASGLPVVALRAGGVGDTVESGTTGLLVEPSERPEHLAAAVLTLIDRPEERCRMAAAARRYALSQSWDAVMSVLRRHYQGLIEEPPGRPIPVHAGC
jgi:glycosyltransferase involved in cell wall biosynthesis